MKQIFLSSLFTSLELLDSIVNYLTCCKVFIASAAMKHDAAIASVQLTLSRQVEYP
jgi:hypothetical protein